MLKDNCFE